MNTNSPRPHDQQPELSQQADPADPTGDQGAPGGDGGAAAPLLDPQAAGPAGASAGNTHLLSSQWAEVSHHPTLDEILVSQLQRPDIYSGPVVQSELYPGAVVSIDWLETGGLIQWSESTDALRQIDRLREAAKACGEPEPYILANQELMIHPRGMGSGRQQHLPYRLEWPGVMLAFDKATRADHVLAVGRDVDGEARSAEIGGEMSRCGKKSDAGRWTDELAR